MVGNDPAKTPPADEPEAKECRSCDRKTHDPKRICPDCRREGNGGDPRAGR